jgi:hypothetical protein
MNECCVERKKSVGDNSNFLMYNDTLKDTLIIKDAFASVITFAMKAEGKSTSSRRTQCVIKSCSDEQKN